MIKIVSKNIVKKDKIEDFKNIAKELVDKSLKEKGCLFYGLHQDIKNKNILTFIEGWENKESIKNHNNSEHFIAIVPKLKELNDESELHIYEEIVF